MSLDDSKCGKKDKEVITIPFTETRCNYKKSTHIFITHMLAPQSSSSLLHFGILFGTTYIYGWYCIKYKCNSLAE